MANEASIEAKEEESVWQSGDCQSKANKKSAAELIPGEDRDEEE